MISARLHDYVVKDILHELVRADAESVRFWHKADIWNNSYVPFLHCQSVCSCELSDKAS